MNPNSKGFPAEVIYDEYADGLVTLEEATNKFVDLLLGDRKPERPRLSVRGQALVESARRLGERARRDGHNVFACPFSPDVVRDAWFQGFYGTEQPYAAEQVVEL